MQSASPHAATVGRRARGRWWLAGALAVAAVAAVVVFRSRASDGGDRRYLTEPVESGSIVATVTATGILNPVTTVQVGTYVSGPIQAIDVDFNSPVKKGQRVARIDPAPFLVKVRKADANLANARARVEKSRADLQLKKLTLERNRPLAAAGTISQIELDTAVSNYEQARAQLLLDEAAVRQAEAELEEARINLGYTDITSPVDGIVVARNVDVGQTVAASFQTPTLFLIAEDLTKMQVNAAVSESDIGTVATGQPATFLVDAYPGRTFQGAVTQVRNAPTTVQNVVTYDVVIRVENPDLALKPGMTANVTITTARRDEAIKIPQRALRFEPEERAAAAATLRPAERPPRKDEPPHVWVLDLSGELRRVEVKTGLADDRHVELLSGELRPGELLAVGLKREAGQTAGAVSPFAPVRRR